ncbi:Na(+)/H(+) antiporter subunit C [Naumannella halotolerans]|uniref:Multisubunit Na+/H+ antiporter MnhC subunit n=1 Tax=Naumannella halotolerans TaxID=993414 RepID=A0A4R7J9W2_9ACTN|nr:Na(+)/H(+) antiporter subunit C [Naumannella halotolerans]TDT34135.1 multisubunit Na+/H+ antiporter MnhC subunit [Naumannella halotolerans]
MNPDMTPSLALVLVGAVVISAGIYLLLERSLTRILIGVLLASNGVNMLFLVASGRAGTPPLVGNSPAEEMADPLPQALVLTAIVITLGTSAFVLTLAYRSFQLNGNDEVADDVEDAQIRELADLDQASQSFDEADTAMPSEDERVIISEDERPEEPEPELDSDADESGDDTDDGEESFDSDGTDESEGDDQPDSDEADDEASGEGPAEDDQQPDPADELDEHIAESDAEHTAEDTGPTDNRKEQR